MYQFNGVPSSNYQYHQQALPGGYSNGQVPPSQHNQVYPQPQNLPMQQQHYQVPQQTAYPPMSQYPSFPTVHQNQAPAFTGYGGNQQQAPTRNGSYSGNPRYASQQPGVHAQSPVATMLQRPVHLGPQTMTPNNPVPRAPQWQTLQDRAKGIPNRSSESCYNCGAPDHWAQDCPEPRRAVPAGQMNRPFKRQKTHGGTITTNHEALQQQTPNQQRGWTDPVVAQRSFPPFNDMPNVQAAPVSEQRSWLHKQSQKPRMSSASSEGASPSAWTQQQQDQGFFTPVPGGSSRQNSWTQQQEHQSGNDTNADSKYQPWSSQPQNQPNSTVSAAMSSNAEALNVQQPHLDHVTLPTTRISERTAETSHKTQADKMLASQAIQWPAQHLPTPAPSSTDSQIPSPATSNLNSVEQGTQQTPRYTESPRNRRDSVSSVHKKTQDPRAQQAEMVANLFNAAALTPASKSNSPENLAFPEERIEDVEDELEELYGLDFSDTALEQNIALSNPAHPVAAPLPSTYEFDANDQPKTANASSTGASLSKYIRDMREEDFLKNVQENSGWNMLKDDPVFAKIKANTATVTFDELIERRCQLVRTFTEADEDSQEDDHPYQETEEERLTREQEERLAALGVTGTAKPVRASPTDAPFTGTPSPAETLVTRRVSGDPGWKHYENGRAVEVRSNNFESPSSATKDGRSVGSDQHHSPSECAPGGTGNVSPDIDGPGQQPYRKRTYSEASEKIDSMPRRQDSEHKQRKPRLKQPEVAAVYG